MSPHAVSADVGWPPKQAAEVKELSERALREGLAAGRIRSHAVVGRSAWLRLIPEELAEDLKAQPRCASPECDEAALADNGGCGRAGHGRVGKPRPAEVGRRISAAKKGKPQLALEPGELTLAAAVEETGHGEITLRDGATLPGRGGRPKLRSRSAPRPGRQPNAIVFRRAELREDLANCPCSYPGCSTQAPGKSGRCAAHAARGEPAVERTCLRPGCGETFVRPVSWLREREGRGHYCSDRCKGLAADVEALRDLNLDGSRDYARRLAGQIERQGLVLTERAAAAAGLSPSRLRTAARGGNPAMGAELRSYGGTLLLVYAPKPFGDWYHRTRGGTQVYGHLASALALDTGARVGRPRGLSPSQETRIHELIAAGQSQRTVVRMVGVTRRQVQRALERTQKVEPNPSRAGT